MSQARQKTLKIFSELISVAFFYFYPYAIVKEPCCGPALAAGLFHQRVFVRLSLLKDR